MTFFLQLTVASIAVFERPSPLEKRDANIRAPPDFEVGTHEPNRRLSELINDCPDAIVNLLQSDAVRMASVDFIDTGECRCDDLVGKSFPGTGELTFSRTVAGGHDLAHYCPKTCQNLQPITNAGRSGACSASTFTKDCLENSNGCVWYIANYTQFNPSKKYIGRCHSYQNCPAWLWGEGVSGQGTSAEDNVGYQFCMGATIPAALASTTSGSCENQRVVRDKLPPWFDKFEGPCYEPLHYWIDTSQERPLGLSHAAPNPFIPDGEHYCSVHTCHQHLNKNNCTCQELLFYFVNELYYTAPCKGQMNAEMAEDDPCIGVLYDQCPNTCQLFQSQFRRTLNKGRQGLTQIGTLRTNIGKLLGLFYYPNMMLMANSIGWIITAFAPFVKLNEYLWCQDCTY